jgi:predicted RNA-binding Zn ribbon-like protein
LGLGDRNSDGILGGEPEPGGRTPAPGDLRIVQRFINSLDIEGETDELTTPAALSTWLRAHGLTRSRLSLNDADLKRAREFRELLRDMALANNGRSLQRRAVHEINAQLATISLIARFDGRETLHLESEGQGLDEALGRIVAIISAEMLRGRWSRLKGCARDVCRWVFYDRSRNRTGTWCTMAICGARTKVSAYYRRQRLRGTESAPTRRGSAARVDAGRRK